MPFRVLTPSGVYAEGEWERREDIPAKIPDRWEHYFETADADILEVPVNATPEQLHAIRYPSRIKEDFK